MNILATNVGDELGDALGVSLGLEHVALGHQELLDVLVVGDDAVVDNNELVIFSGSVGMGVGVRGGSMGCPPVNK